MNLRRDSHGNALTSSEKALLAIKEQRRISALEEALNICGRHYQTKDAVEEMEDVILAAKNKVKELMK